MCTIFFDIASAFDKVWHRGLVFKLLKLNFPDFIICWINEFLTNRVFAIKINETLTKKYEILAGAPQGAVMSPVWFSIFINYMPMNFNKNKSYSLLFADDLCYMNIFKKATNSKKQQIEIYLKSIEKWLLRWRLKMSPSKCSYIIFSANKKEVEQMDLKLFNEPTTRS